MFPVLMVGFAAPNRRVAGLPPLAGIGVKAPGGHVLRYLDHDNFSTQTSSGCRVMADRKQQSFGAW
jgi:hypothetical protein